MGEEALPRWPRYRASGGGCHLPHRQRLQNALRIYRSWATGTDSSPPSARERAQTLSGKRTSCSRRWLYAAFRCAAQGQHPRTLSPLTALLVDVMGRYGADDINWNRIGCVACCMLLRFDAVTLDMYYQNTVEHVRVATEGTAMFACVHGVAPPPYMEHPWIHHYRECSRAQVRRCTQTVPSCSLFPSCKRPIFDVPTLLSNENN